MKKLLVWLGFVLLPASLTTAQENVLRQSMTMYTVPGQQSA
jgi:hypothetical protein